MLDERSIFFSGIVDNAHALHASVNGSSCWP